MATSSRHDALARGALVVLGVALALRPGAARGQSPDASREQARQYFERGVAFANDARWQDAIRELEASRAIRTTPAVLFNLGFAYRAVGRNLAALEAFEAFLRDPGVALRDRAAEVRGHVSSLRASLGTLRVRLAPASATLTIDGAPAPAGRAEHAVDPGRHVLVAEAAGFNPATRVVVLGPGASEDVALELAPVDRAGAGPAAPNATASVAPTRILLETTTPRAQVAIDGRPAGSGRVDVRVAPGPHSVEVRAEGYEPYRRDVTVGAGEALRLDVRLTERRGGGVLASPWFWVGATVLVAGGVTAGVLIWSATTPPPFQGALGHYDQGVTVRP